MKGQWHGGKGGTPRPTDIPQSEIDRKEHNWRTNPENEAYDKEVQARREGNPTSFKGEF